MDHRHLHKHLVRSIKHGEGGDHHAHILDRLVLGARALCLAGAIAGEMAGFAAGAAAGLGTGFTLPLAFALAAVPGLSLPAIPLMRVGVSFSGAVAVLFPANALSIIAVAVVMDLVVTVIPGATGGIRHPMFWMGAHVALAAAALVGYPVHGRLLDKEKVHSVVMRHREGH